MRIGRRLKAVDIIDVLTALFILRGAPGHVGSDNGPESVAKAVRDWITAVGSNTTYIVPGSLWANGYCVSFNFKLGDELLDGEIFYTVRGAQIVIAAWRLNYNTNRPHSAPGSDPPAPEAISWPPAPRRINAANAGTKSYYAPTIHRTAQAMQTTQSG